MGKGRIIALEGPDGVGKSSLALALTLRLRENGMQAENMRLPGLSSGTLGRLVYELHHDHQAFGIPSLHPTSLQLLHAAAHIDLIHREIRPRLASGEWIVLDRYWWSTVAYGRYYGADERSLQLMQQLARLHWSDVEPARLFLIERQGSDRSLAQLYQQVAGDEPDSNVVPVVNDDTLEQALDVLWDSVVPLFTSHRPTKTTQHVAADATVRPHSTHCWTPLAPAVPTRVYDTYWRFAAERQEVLFRRLASNPPPWTSDLILQRHRFTNAYRAADRVSQYLIREVIYSDSWEPADLVFRILLFKLFNRIETWEHLERNFGEITWEGFRWSEYARCLEQARSDGAAIYSAAYIMASARAYGRTFKHENHLLMLQDMLEEELPSRIADASSLEDVYRMLRAYPSIGPFLAYQFAIDLNYSTLMDFDESSFVVPGPGARDGIAKCFADTGGLNEADVIRWVADRQEAEFRRLGLDFKMLGDRHLQLIDCQNLFCEVDKYARVAHPESVGVSGRTKIKQVFTPRPSSLSLWFPPKWGLEDRFGGPRPIREAEIRGNLFG